MQDKVVANRTKKENEVDHHWQRWLWLIKTNQHKHNNKLNNQTKKKNLCNKILTYINKHYLYELKHLIFITKLFNI